jgi:hypothetical protein
MKTVELSDIENIFNQFVAAYGSKFSLPTKETVELWVDIFKDCKQETFNKAVMECIKKCAFPPAISDVWQAYSALYDKEEDNLIQLKQWWEVMKGVYPADMRDPLAGQYLFYAVDQLEGQDEKMAFMQNVSHEVHKYVENHDVNELPYLSTCIREVIWGEQTGGT